MIETWSQGAADTHMDQSILVDLAAIIERHPWWRARADLTVALLDRLGVTRGARVLDAGCGWGVTLSALERAGYRSVGLDVSRMALERLDAPGRQLIEADLTQTPGPGRAPFDAVLALDVIEHLDDDQEAVANLASLLKPGGFLIVSVPAIPAMFSEFDRVQGHRRRYDRARLQEAFARTELQLERVFWWGQWLERRLRASRNRSRARPGDSPSDTYRRYLTLPPWPLTLAARVLFSREQPRALEGGLDRGTSLFAVARRSLVREERDGFGQPQLRSGHDRTASLVMP